MREQMCRPGARKTSRRRVMGRSIAVDGGLGSHRQDQVTLPDAAGIAKASRVARRGGMAPAGLVLQPVMRVAGGLKCRVARAQRLEWLC